jgi:hypothetical protein
MIRGKFVVESSTKYAGNYATVVLQARSDKSIPEDVSYAEATPNGKIEMTVTVPAVIEALVPGKVFFVDLHEAPEGTSSYHV